jgi:hypothetical protein
MADHNNSGSVNAPRQNGDPGPTRRAVSIVRIFLASLFGIQGQPIQQFSGIDSPLLNISVDWRGSTCGMLPRSG